MAGAGVMLRALRYGAARSAMRVGAHVRPLQVALPIRSRGHVPTLIQSRCFSSDPPAEGMSNLSDSDFARHSEATLNSILEMMDGIEAILPDADITLSQGVLTINLGEDGTWVLNKQGPNKQIWWSSPISGPKRFEFDSRLKKWFNTRDKDVELIELLTNEIEELSGIIVVTE
ncbi:iron donor protein CyaY [Aphanomyces invadans]|uniref:Iron donor protein CyaY n=1 Tax=Aphanomyces invadans TaxID=157072 RepID=A0A024TMR2_9STRA|nr:iron donor protein CyaY [Aphanomyces invadans]ETV94657.1 iron donor protein CyaY [Aphanomyces invadans]RHY29687.1 hypothetical protein DYB32_004949 [Aphanomyces invadans]|eukprot:XP_008876602.1 iron donor protein CyaY [Aphanomyces invadans]